MKSFPKRIKFLSDGCEVVFKEEVVQLKDRKIVKSELACYEYVVVPKKSDKLGKTVDLSLSHLTRLESFELIEFS